MLVSGGTATGKSAVAKALAEQVAARTGMPLIELSDAMYVPNCLFAENEINAVVLWNEIRNGASFLTFLACSTHRFTVAIMHGQDWLSSVRKLLWAVGQQLNEGERVAAISALEARLVAVIKTDRGSDITITTPVPWPP